MQMHRLFVFAISLALTLLASCTAKDTLPHPDAGPVTVGFRVGGEQTRTQINDDGRSTSWSKDDRIALWARNEASEFTLSAQPFDIYYRSVNNAGAYFTSTLPQAMAEGRYTYYAAYPLPESLDGTRATFTIPAVQDGRVGSGADIMIATPAEASQLGPLENNPDLSLTMQHLLHVLRFYIPEGDNVLGEPVERIVITMPQQVAGRATADITAPDGGMTLAEGGNTVELNLTEPLDASTAAEYAYACAAIFPSTQYGADDVMQVSLYSKNYAATVDDILLAGRTFAAGHVTPVPLHPVLKEYQNKIRFTIAANNLGEDVKTITLTAPEGVNWSQTGNNVLTVDASRLNSGGYYDLNFDTAEAIALYEALANQPVNVQFESENAIVTSDITMPDTKAAGTSAEVALTVPYLYYEDFAQIDTFDNNCDVGTGINSSSAGNVDAVSFTWQDNANRGNWTGARVGGYAGVAVRSSCRYEGGGVGLATTYASYPGRIDSAPITNLKNPVRVKITFDYVGGQDAWMMDSNKDKGGTYGNPVFSYGYTTDNTALNGATDIENVLDEGINVETDKTWESPYNTRTDYIENCVNGTRLSWKVTVNRVGSQTSWTGIFGANGNHYLYIDNIRIQIAK